MKSLNNIYVNYCKHFNYLLDKLYKIIIFNLIIFWFNYIDTSNTYLTLNTFLLYLLKINFTSIRI